MVDSRKQRLYYRRGESNDYVHIAWFQLKPTYDLYWGNPHPTLDHAAQTIDARTETQVTFNAPPDWQNSPLVTSSQSHHESGVMHVNAGGSGAASRTDWCRGRPDALTEPMLLSIVITKPLYHHEPYRNSLTKGNSHALVIRADDDQWSKRQYLEFYIMPSGEFRPRPVMKVPDDYEFEPLVATLDVDMDRLLVVRHATLTTEQPPQWDEHSPSVGFWANPGPPPTAKPA